jgi:16S rRNA (cytosine967-C5)-methyltransferase
VSVKLSPARIAAFEALQRVALENAYAGALIASPRRDLLSIEDRGLFQELTLGALRWQGRLDALIEYYARRPVAKLDLEVVIALRLGLYQLQYLSRIPAYAAINESVNLVKARKKMSAAPLVNAVLRSAVRSSAPALSQAAESSHPQWLLDRWLTRFGEDETLRLMQANNQPPRITFRYNPSVAPPADTDACLAAQGIHTLPSSLAPGAATVESGALSSQSEPVANGWLYLQDEASQLVAHLAAGWTSNLKSQISALRFLDLCAAPGSKATLTASLLPPGSMVVASDLHPHRLRTMCEIAGRLKVGNLHAVALDGTRELPFEEAFDAVLLDAPCTGLGTLQRQPEIKWRLSEDKIAELAELQSQLLARAAQKLKPGGILTYSVCSTEPEEGEDVIAAFRETNPTYRDITRERLTELGVDPAPLLTSAFGARTFPHRQHSEAFFFCTLWKRK